MIEIRQVEVQACPNVSDAIRATRAHDMKTFVAGTAVKYTMIISETTATCKISFSNPCSTKVVDAATMTSEADYVYSYTYQTPSDDVYTGRWVVTLTALSGSYTALTQDKFTLTSQEP